MEKKEEERNQPKNNNFFLLQYHYICSVYVICFYAFDFDYIENNSVKYIQ